jgi:hypothetical protein
MSGLKFTSDPSPSVPDKRLDSPDVGPALVGGTVTYDGDLNLAGIKFGFGVEANASITAFNSLDDKDADGILGRPSKEDDTFKVSFPPQMELTEDDAWLKYRASAKLKVSVGGAVAPVDFKLDFSKGAVFTDFHRHDRDASARSAVIADVQSLRFAGSVDDVLALGAKEGVSYAVRGELSASVTVSWSDVITAGLGSLSNVLGPGKMLGLKISPAASVTFHVGLVDDFLVVFTKGAAARTRVAVKKSDSREVGVGATLGITVKWSDEAAVKEALTDIYKSLAGETEATIDKILAKAPLEDLSAAERKVVDVLIKRLGLGDVAQTLKDIKERWEALKKKVEGAIDTAAKAKIALGFAYDYLRVSTEDTLLVCDVDNETLRRYHNDLMLCDLRGLLEWVESNPTALVKYLNQKTLTRSQAWGFSLGIGPWNVGGKDKLELTGIVQHNINPDERIYERIAYRGLRGYEGKLGDKASWNVDFKAEMPGFAPAGEATACQFRYGLHFKWLWDQRKLKNDLSSFLDYAVIWRVITQDNVQEVLNMLAGQMDEQAQVALEMTIEDEALRALLPLASAAAGGDLIVRALAKSMPYMDMYAGRRLPKFRELLYAPLWQFYFQNDSLPINSYPSTAAASVEKIAQQEHIPDGVGLAARERGTSPNLPAYQDSFTFSGQVNKHGYTGTDYSGVHRSWLAFAEGLNTLNDGLKPQSCAPHKTIEKVFKRLTAFWSQSLFVRATGVYLIDVAAANGDLARKLNRALTVTVKNGDVFRFAASV